MLSNMPILIVLELAAIGAALATLYRATFGDNINLLYLSKEAVTDFIGASVGIALWTYIMFPIMIPQVIALF